VPETRRLLSALVSTTVNDPQTATGWSILFCVEDNRATAEASHYKRPMIIESEHVNRRT
jgi:hypothetical protein